MGQGFTRVRTRERTAGEDPVLKRALERPHVRCIVYLQRRITARRIGSGVIVGIQILSVLAHDVITAVGGLDEPEDVFSRLGVRVIRHAGKA